MVIVALDTNALMVPVELEIRIFEELELLLPSPEFVIPEPVLQELSSLKHGKGVASRAARVGLDLAKMRCKIIKTENAAADESFLELSYTSQIDYVVTNDLSLRDRLLGTGIPVVGVRGQNTLHIMEP
ncbi:MAG: twitching motility protein PilT [Halobacteriales archaeon]|nr:twitching motility protein PilT [Chloroflexota bacterium]|tara:strand:+ start:806 stop:1189 length:384 start_codon:yes stop_codon:yes gene_type:complete